MSPLVEVEDVNAWLDVKKANITTLEDELLEQVESQVLGVMQLRYDTETWVLPTSTPLLVKRIISMLYAGWHYLKIYSTDDSSSDYGEMLLRDAETLLTSISNGAISIPDSVLVPVVSISIGSLISPESILTEPKFSMESEW